MNLNSGVLPSQEINKLHKSGNIKSISPFINGQVQPASLDLRLGTRAWQVPASFLPGIYTTVEEKLKQFKTREINLTKDKILKTGNVYIVKLQESLNLPEEIEAITNPKSSTGRLDVFTRVIFDEGQTFDRIPKCYKGPLYAEICPKSFPIIVRNGSRLSQIRFRNSDQRIPDSELKMIYKKIPTLPGLKLIIKNGVLVSVDLIGEGKGSIVGFKAKKVDKPIDIDLPNMNNVNEFWEPILSNTRNSLTLDTDEFYILASREPVHIPPKYAAEMVAYDPLIGEFRVHYAGFFDPGFGHFRKGPHGSRAVLEVRSHDVPFILENGQPVGLLEYQKMLDQPKTVYGEKIGSNYQGQSLKLSKHFKMK